MFFFVLLKETVVAVTTVSVNNAPSKVITNLGFCFNKFFK